MATIPLNTDQIAKVKRYAKAIADQVQDFIRKHSSVCVERTILRLYGVDGINADETPLPNRLVEILQENGNLASGVSKAFAAAMLESGRDVQTTAELIDQGKLDFGSAAGKFAPGDILKKETELARNAITLLDESRKRKQEKQKKFGIPKQPWRYMIVATGNIYEDRTQAKAAAFAGSDIIAVIRSTAQSLLDYLPYGATT